MSKAWRRGGTRAHRRMRALVFARDAALGYGCRAHEEGWCARASDRQHECRGRAEHAHHTRGYAVTGNDPQHMVASCAPCNQHIGDPTRGADPQPKPRTRW